jgi:hypothetical protein
MARLSMLFFCLSIGEPLDGPARNEEASGGWGSPPLASLEDILFSMRFAPPQELRRECHRRIELLLIIAVNFL